MSAAAGTVSFSSTDKLALGVCHLPRLWQRTLNGGGAKQETDWIFDNLVLHGLCVPFEEAYQFLYRQRPSYEEFEDWVRRLNGGIVDPASIERINAAIEEREPPAEWGRKINEIDAMDDVLSQDDLAFWDEHGYVIVRHAVSPEECSAAADAVWQHLDADPNDRQTWYSGPRDHGIMVQLFRDPALDANRHSARVHKAFSQLWGTSDLWPTYDRVSFNPPVTDAHPFPGPRLHWDVSLAMPIPFGVQGLIYLTDTPADRGAFTCVPGFNRSIAKWMGSLEPGTDPRTVDLDPYAQPIAGAAADLVIWHQALPHGSSPNTADQPRIVQYISMFPTDARFHAEWR
jgi:hypothetical protein